MEHFKGTIEGWNAFFLKQPTQAGLFLQSWEWGEFLKSVGYTIRRFQIHGSFVQVVERKLPIGLRYWYVPRGILNQIILSSLMQFAKEQGIVFLRCEPGNDFDTKGVSVPAVQPKETSIVLLDDENAMLQRMHSKTRYNIRLADKRGVNVVASKEYADEFIRLIHVTGKRNVFGLHDEVYYRAQIKQESTELVVGIYEGKVIASHLYWRFGDTITYLHGASDNVHRNVMAPYAVHWYMMHNGLHQGFKQFDLWGIDDQKWTQLTQFKRRFGGRDYAYVGCYDNPVRMVMYQLYRFVKKLRK